MLFCCILALPIPMNPPPHVAVALADAAAARPPVLPAFSIKFLFPEALRAAATTVQEVEEVIKLGLEFELLINPENPPTPPPCR